MLVPVLVAREEGLLDTATYNAPPGSVGIEDDSANTSQEKETLA